MKLIDSILETSLSEDNKSITWLHPLRDIAIDHAQKGYWIFDVFAALLFVLFLRLPPDDLAKVCRAIYNIMHDIPLMGWIVAFIVFGIMASLMRLQHSIHKREMKRISDERTGLQAEQLGADKITSSQQKK